MAPSPAAPSWWGGQSQLLPPQTVPFCEYFSKVVLRFGKCWDLCNSVWVWAQPHPPASWAVRVWRGKNWFEFGDFQPFCVTEGKDCFPGQNSIYINNLFLHLLPMVNCMLSSHQCQRLRKTFWMHVIKKSVLHHICLILVFCHHRNYINSKVRKLEQLQEGKIFSLIIPCYLFGWGGNTRQIFFFS